MLKYAVPVLRARHYGGGRHEYPLDKL
jgi:hypothetical protein